MDAIFRTKVGVEFRIAIDPPLGDAPQATIGRLSASEAATYYQPGRVALTMARNESDVWTSYLERSEARAIASALVGAAAEL